MIAGRGRLSKEDKAYGTRTHPREFLTAQAALDFCKSSGRALWVRLPMYGGNFHIWPGGRKEFWPDRILKARSNR